MEVNHSANQIMVVDQDNIQGTVDVQTLSRPDQTTALITYNGNRHVQVPVALLQLQVDGTYYLPLQLKTLQSTTIQHNRAEETVLPLIHEEVHVDKRTVETGRVQLTKQVHVEEKMVEALLRQERVEIERIPLEQLVEKAPEVRYEGDILVIPVVEEVLVVEKRLLLKEEIRINKQVEEVHHQQPVPLRREAISIAHIEPAT